MDQPLKIVWLGLRGFPQVQGGIETHAENLCPLLAELGCDIQVIVRKRYQRPEVGDSWRGVRFVPLWSPRSKHLEALVHSVLGVLWAASKRPDVLHIHGIGPSLVVPLARLCGLTVVMTHHGPDYEREKWGRLARVVLRTGERLGIRFAQRPIVISQVIQQLVKQKYGIEASTIPNGVPRPVVPSSFETLQRLGLAPHRYILTVSRLVPEKRHVDLLRAFAQSGLEDWKLVIVGSSDNPDGYERELLEFASRCPNVVCTGTLTGEPLRELYAHAGMFVLPSSHEGLSITLLEAMSYGLPVIASAIPANLCLRSGQISYFPLGDIEALAVLLRRQARRSYDSTKGEGARLHVRRMYDWREIARRTQAEYREVTHSARSAFYDAFDGSLDHPSHRER